jgi:hypothetical protein
MHERIGLSLSRAFRRSSPCHRCTVSVHNINSHTTTRNGPRGGVDRVAMAAARRYRAMTVSATATAVLPPRAAAVAMKTPVAGSAASSAEAPRWEVRRRWQQRQLAGSTAAAAGRASTA